MPECILGMQVLWDIEKDLLLLEEKIQPLSSRILGTKEQETSQYKAVGSIQRTRIQDYRPPETISQIRKREAKGHIPENIPRPHFFLEDTESDRKAQSLLFTGKDPEAEKEEGSSTSPRNASQSLKESQDRDSLLPLTD